MPMPGPAQTWGGGGSSFVSGPYIGGGDRGPGSVKPISRPINTGGPPPTYSGSPASTTVPTPPSNVLGAGAVRPTGPSAGFDPQYLQNLATAIGGLFSRPGGSLSFNPLGNLSDVSSPSLGFGNAASPGLPPTMLQDAINGLAFLFNPPAPPAAATGGSSPMVGGGVNGGGNGRGYRLA